jgi:hypothetical protein
MRCVSCSIRSLFLLLAVVPALAETAVLECVADSTLGRPASAEAKVLPLRPALSLEFNTRTVKAWRVTKATLLIHVASGLAPERVAIWVAARKKVLPVIRERDGWLRVELDVGMASAAVSAPILLEGKGGASVNTRESLSLAPYLIMEGSAR